MKRISRILTKNPLFIAFPCVISSYPFTAADAWAINSTKVNEGMLPSSLRNILPDPITDSTTPVCPLNSRRRSIRQSGGRCGTSLSAGIGKKRLMSINKYLPHLFYLFGHEGLDKFTHRQMTERP